MGDIVEFKPKKMQPLPERGQKYVGMLYDNEGNLILSYEYQYRGSATEARKALLHHLIDDFDAVVKADE